MVHLSELPGVNSFHFDQSPWDCFTVPATSMPLRLPSILLLLLPLASALASGPHDKPLASGQSISGLWPRHPHATATGAVPLQILPAFAFKHNAPNAPSKRLQRAFARYRDIILSQRELWVREAAPLEATSLLSLDVVLDDASADMEAYPQLGDNETFALDVAPGGATLHASSFSGVHRGLEAFAQLTIKVCVCAVVCVICVPRCDARALCCMRYCAAFVCVCAV